MSVPKLKPTTKVFREAQEHHRARVSVSSSELANLGGEARARAFWVSGLARHASVVETHRLIDDAISKGGTIAEFRAGFTKMLADNGGAVIGPKRQNNIFRTNVSLAYGAGRMKQLSDPDIIAERPILMYPLSPHDEDTSAICLRLEGFMAEHDSPVWRHIAPPNHFQERHMKLLSLSREQAAKRGTVWQQPEGSGEYPVIDGQQILPDPGFDHAPHLLATDAQELARQWGELKGLRRAKSAANYDLEPLTDAGHRLPLPPASERVDLSGGWERLRKTIEVPEGLDETIVPDLLGDGVVVNRQSYDAIFGERPEMSPLLWDLLTNAGEVWMIPAETSAGVVAVKRYLAVIGDGDDILYLWAEQGPMGWLARGGFASEEELEALRTGYLATTRATRRNQ